MNKRLNIISYLIPRLQDILFIFFFYLVLILGTNLFRDGDPGRHITIGKYMIENGTILTHDIFSFTKPGEAITPHEWLAQAAYGGAYLILGLNGVVILAALLISTAILLVYQELLRRNMPKLLAFTLAFWVAISTMLHWLARPHLFAFVLFAIFTPRLARLAEGEDIPLWHFPLIMLIWANMHATLFLGFISLAAVFAGAAWESWAQTKSLNSPLVKKLLLISLACFLVTFINPASYHIWTEVVGYALNRYLIDLTSETRALDFHTLGSYPFMLTIAGGLWIFSQSKLTRPMHENFLIAGWTLLGLYGARNAPLFSIICIPFFAEHIKPLFSKSPFAVRLNNNIEKVERQLNGYVFPVAVLIITISMLSLGVKLDAARQGFQFNKIEYPVEATNWIEKNPQTGHMFNYFPWGGYLIYRLYPGYQVFIDAQLDFYGETLTREHQQIFNAETGWQQTLDKYDIQWILIPSDARLALILPYESQWKLLYQDKTAIIFRRAQP